MKNLDDEILDDIMKNVVENPISTSPAALHLVFFGKVTCTCPKDSKHHRTVWVRPAPAPLTPFAAREAARLYRQPAPQTLGRDY